MDFGPLSQMLAMNPYLMGGGPVPLPNGASMMQQLMGAAGLHQGWAGALSGKTVNQLWMKEDPGSKVGTFTTLYSILDSMQNMSADFRRRGSCRG
jgi:hypothetical protein